MAGIGVFGGMSSDVARTSPNPSMDRRATSDGRDGGCSLLRAERAVFEGVRIVRLHRPQDR
jgi:hypothetical protein